MFQLVFRLFFILLLHFQLVFCFQHIKAIITTKEVSKVYKKKLNCSFNQLTFIKLWFWPLRRKKLQNSPFVLHLWQFWPPMSILTRSMLMWRPKWGATCYFYYYFLALVGQNCYRCKT